MGNSLTKDLSETMMKQEKCVECIDMYSHSYIQVKDGYMFYDKNTVYIYSDMRHIINHIKLFVEKYTTPLQYEVYCFNEKNEAHRCELYTSNMEVHIDGNQYYTDIWIPIISSQKMHYVIIARKDDTITNHFGFNIEFIDKRPTFFNKNILGINKDNTNFRDKVFEDKLYKVITDELIKLQ